MMNEGASCDSVAALLVCVSLEESVEENQSFQLAELIRHTSEQLKIAATQDSDDAVMEFKGCELEIAVTVSKEASGGIKFHIVSAGGKYAASELSRVKLGFGAISGQAKQYNLEADGISKVPQEGGDPNG